MPKLDAKIAVADIMDALSLLQLPQECEHSRGGFVHLDAHFSQENIDENASEMEPEYLPIGVDDIRNGINALQVGDRTMARTLLLRALEHDAEACRAIEEALR